MLKTSTRILLNSGDSIVTPQAAAELLFLNGELPPGVKVQDSFDTDAYHTWKGVSVGERAIDGPAPSPQQDFSEGQVESLLDKLATHRRDDTSEAAHFQRIEKEIDYFERIGAVGFLLNLDNLIQEFQKADVIWGVGRGSSCASYLLYLLRVHDINPIKYDIPFSEFSKENDDDG